MAYSIITYLLLSSKNLWDKHVKCLKSVIWQLQQTPSPATFHMFTCSLVMSSNTVSLGKSKSKLCYDRWLVTQSVLEWGSHLEPWPDFCFLSDNCGFLEVGHLPWREDGSVVYTAAGPCQHSHSGAWVPGYNHILLPQIWYSLTWRARFLYLYSQGTGWPSFTSGNGSVPSLALGYKLKSKLYYDQRSVGQPVPGAWHPSLKVKVMLRVTISQSVCLGVERLLVFMTRCFPLFDGYCRVFAGTLSDERSGLSFASQSLQNLVICQYIHKYLHFICLTYKVLYIQYIQSLFQSRLSTANYALLIVVSATTAVWTLESSYTWPLPSLRLLFSVWGFAFSISSSQKSSQSYITTDSQLASLSCCQAPIWDPETNFPSSFFNYF
jgi:hypothetical protein